MRARPNPVRPEPVEGPPAIAPFPLRPRPRYLGRMDALHKNSTAGLEKDRKALLRRPDTPTDLISRALLCRMMESQRRYRLR